MDINFHNASGGEWRADCSLAFIFEGERPVSPVLFEQAPWMEISPALRDAAGKKEEMTLLHGHPELSLPRVLVLGLGKKADASLQTLRLAVAKALQYCRTKGFQSVGLPVEGLLSLTEAYSAPLELLVKEVVLSALVGLYSCESYRGTGKKENSPEDPRRFTLLLSEKHTPDTIHRAAREGEAEAAGIVFARELINGPANHITPTVLAEKASELARTHTFSCTVLKPEQIRALGMGAFWAVAQGAKEEPRFIILEHCPKGKEQDAPLVFIGKGLTFDTGGISLKPAAKMHEMKGDMGGAAAVLGFFKALGALANADELPRVIGLIPTTENMPGGHATRPGDTVTTLSGQTVEILNTDAEGRLILCDAITYAQKEWKPAAIVDIATLTGACVIALGDLGAGVFTKDKELRRCVLDAAETTGELYWPLPLWDDYDANLKSDVADIANIGPREGGAIHAALFLQRFVEKNTRWMHLDIAGPGYVVKPTALSPVPGGTGTGVRIFCELARKLKVKNTA